MYWLVSKLSEGRPSVTIVANGAGITLKEVEANVRAARRTILIEDSGRAADALVSVLRKAPVADAEVRSLREGLRRRHSRGGQSFSDREHGGGSNGPS
jgi:hypothetical protein